MKKKEVLRHSPILLNHLSIFLPFKKSFVLKPQANQFKKDLFPEMKSNLCGVGT